MSIIREVMKENRIDIDDLLKVKENFKKNIMSDENFNKMMYLRDQISLLEFIKKTIIDGYFELTRDKYVLKFNIIQKYKFEEIEPDKIVIYLKYNGFKYSIEKIVVFLTNEIRTMDEVNEIIRKTIEFKENSEISQIYNQVKEIRELIGNMNIFDFDINSINKLDEKIYKCKEQLENLTKERQYVTTVDMEKEMLDRNDELIVKLNNMKFDKRFHELYFKEDPYEGFFRGGGLRLSDFVDILLNNIDSYWYEKIKKGIDKMNLTVYNIFDNREPGKGIKQRRGSKWG